jgi:four helix bundle protein
MRKDLEDRLVVFSGNIIIATRKLKKEFISQHLTEQINRSSTSAALNYGEAQSAETRKDFIHKIGIVLKELRESYINLRIMKAAGLVEDSSEVDGLISENNELIAIFTKTLFTARSNSKSS